MLSLLLILYEDSGTDRYATHNQGYGDEAMDYGSDTDSDRRYLAEFFDAADSYLAALDSDHDGDAGYGGPETAEPYGADSESYGAASGGYSSGPTIITVVYEEMYDPDYLL